MFLKPRGKGDENVCTRGGKRKKICVGENPGGEKKKKGGSEDGIGGGRRRATPFPS